MIYFEDLQEGVQPFSPEIVVDGKEMLEYNHKYDPWPFHINEKAAKASPFGGLIASGGYTISLAYLLSHKIYNTSESVWAFLGGIDSQMKFSTPVYAGDTLRYTLEVINKRLSNKPGRGIVNIVETLSNQNNDIVFTAKTVMLVATRPMVE
jgi:acyl dehydratase